MHITADLFHGVRTIAVLGAKDVAGQPVNTVGRYLLRRGFEVYPVHPVRKQVWGLTAWPCLAAVPAAIDLVDVFRAPQYCAEHAMEAAALAVRPRVFWMQSGIESPEAAAVLEQARIVTIQNACLMVEHRRLFPETA